MDSENDAVAARREIRKIEDAVTVGTTLPISWFRGHSKKYGTLTPIAFRVPKRSRGGYREYWLAERFRLRAGSIASQLPPWNDHLRWLLLMQHYGLPTRLLDWTESVLVALYFAVQAPLSDDGEVWCIRPDALNNRSNYFLHSADRPIVRYLAAEIFITSLNERQELLRDLKLESSVTTNPIAFLPPMGFPRMVAQSSRFTIHPSPDSGGGTLESLLSAPREIVRYVVPANCKNSLSRALTALEITAETLFCSLDALSTTIKLDVYDADRGEAYPDPPVFD